MELISAKDVEDAVSKYGSRVGTNMKGFASSNVVKGNNYALVDVSIDGLLERDKFLREEIKNIETKDDVGAIFQPILLGQTKSPINNKLEGEKNVVLDGYGRIAQAIKNGQNTIKAYVNLEGNTAEAYHKAKKDGSNPELVKAVEELLGKPKETSPTPNSSNSNWSSTSSSNTKTEV